MPHERNRYFAGRSVELDSLRETFTVGREKGITQAISGLGGIGKTQTAIRYAWGCKEREESYPDYEFIFWTRAGSKTALLAGYQDIATMLNLGLSNPNDLHRTALEVRKWLEENANWLLIFDNVDEPNLLHEYRPRNASGHILLTSRTHHFKANLHVSNSIQLRSLHSADAVSFLFQRTERDAIMASDEERHSAGELALELGYFPLALEQAAAYICAEDKHFIAYLAAYREQEQELLNAIEPETGEYYDEANREYKTVRTTWAINFQSVEKANPASSELLRVVAFVASDDIPFEFVVWGTRNYGPPLSTAFASARDASAIENAYDDLLKPLTQYSLIEKNRDAYTFNVHRMVQSVSRSRMPQGEQQDMFLRVINVLCAVFPPAEFSNWFICERLVSHTTICLERAHNNSLEIPEVGSLCNQIAGYFTAKGRFKEAKVLYERSLSIYRKVISSEAGMFAVVLNNLARLHMYQGNYDIAEPLYRESLVNMRRAWPEGHAFIANCLSGLAGLHIERGRYQEAEEFYIEGLEIRQKLGSGNELYLVESYLGLASVLQEQNRFQESEKLYKLVLAFEPDKLPLQHPDRAMALNGLGVLYLRLKRDSEAEILFSQALEIVRAIYPEGHQYVTLSLSNLGEAYRRQGRYNNAMTTYLQSLAYVPKTFGLQHPTSHLIFQNFNVLLREQAYNQEVVKMPKSSEDVSDTR